MAVDLRGTGAWPKELPEFTDDQRDVRDRFMALWLEVLPGRYGVIERFNHGYPAAIGAPGGRTLELGAGVGEHIRFEDLSAQEYYALELRKDLAAAIGERHPGV